MDLAYGEPVSGKPQRSLHSVEQKREPPRHDVCEADGLVEQLACSLSQPSNERTVLQQPEDRGAIPQSDLHPDIAVCNDL